MDIQYILRAENASGNTGGLEFIRQNPGIAVPYLCILIFSMVFGTVGNLLIIGVIIMDKEVKGTGNIFICNLAIADICVSGFVDVFNVIGLLEGEVWFSKHPGSCNVVAAICLTACFCSLNSIGAVSFNRYIHICHHSLYKKLFTKRKCIVFCIGLWIYSFLLESPNLYGWGRHVYDRKVLTCLWDRTTGYSTFMVTAGIFVPSVIIGISYLRIYIFVYQSRRKLSGRKQSKYKERKQRESVQLALTLFIIFATFVTCWMPYAVVILADQFDTFSAPIHMFTLLIAHMNSSINSIIYGVFNRKFRYGYIRLLQLNKICPNIFASKNMNGFHVSSREEDINCSSFKPPSSDPPANQNSNNQLNLAMNTTSLMRNNTFIPGISE